VKDGSLLAADFRAGQIPAGPQGPKGNTGAPGISGLTYVQKASPLIAPGASDGAKAPCPAGKKVIAGGGLTEKDTPIVESIPIGNQWSVIVRNDTANPVVLVAYAVCAQVS
jgi:hypothetical protein